MPRTLLFDRSARARFTVGGSAAVATLNGLVTNDIATLSPGEGAYAAVLTPKGKIVADLRVLLLRDGTLWLDTGAAAAPGLRAMLAKYVNPRFARVADVSDATAMATVGGADALRIVSDASGIAPDALSAMATHTHVDAASSGAGIRVVRIGALADRDVAFDIVTERAAFPAVWDALVAAGAVPGDDTTWEQLRIARGEATWGTDMDETTLPQEANLDERHAVSYTKGCYIGQETVARIHFRGHVNRTLRRVIIDGSAAPPHGAPLHDADGAPMGDVRSSIVTPDGVVIGIAMVRREVADDSALRVTWDGRETGVRVVQKAKGAIV